MCCPAHIKNGRDGVEGLKPLNPIEFDTKVIDRISIQFVIIFSLIFYSENFAFFLVLIAI